MLAFQHLKEVFEQTPLFESKTWKLSPEAFPLSDEQLQLIEAIGDACYAFHLGLETLYLRSIQNRNLLRNKELRAPWVAEFLDRGKPPALLQHARDDRLKGRTPLILRPDLLITEDGFALSEMDAVPGGIGLTAFLNELYSEPDGTAEGNTIVGSMRSMLMAFYDTLANSVSERSFPFIAILVSDEAATYRPEMEWIASQLQLLGKRVFVFHPNEVIPLGNQLFVPMDGNPQRVDIVYRFWELFDLENLASLDHILEAWKEGQLNITPPMRPFQEEKLALGLFHHPQLQPFWKENLSSAQFKLLHHIIPHTWIMDPAPVPPCAVLDAPHVGGQPIYDWRQLGEASKRERDLILKISGFDETAWGARSVVLGSDVPREQWASAIDEAVSGQHQSLYVLQRYRKPIRVEHPVYREDGSLSIMSGRVRLCPYYFITNGRAELHGILATLCPADKKIIHGMKDAALIPCRRASSNPSHRSHE
jgi:hypothetical protein